MKLKSLLLGSAAAMVAVTGAQAADAIVVEPEPIEYVRICDAYGAGYFFIPGTETCLRFSGFVRTSYSHVDVDVTRSDTGARLTGGAGTSFSGDEDRWLTRARIDMNVRSETDIGTLATQVRFEAGDSADPSGTSFRADVALISIAGFRAGQNGATFWSANQGFGGVDLEAATIGTDGFYSFDDSMMLDYTWDVDNLAVTVGIENPSTGGLAGSLDGTRNGVDDVNFYAGFNYEFGISTLAFTAAHDSGAIDAFSGDRGGWAYSVALSLDLSEYVPGGKLHAMWQDDGDYSTTYVGNSSPFVNEESAYGLAFHFNATDEIQLIGLWNHAEGTGVEGDADIFTAGINWFPAATQGLSIRAAYSHLDVERTLAPTAGTALAGTLVDVESDSFEITLRRNF